MNTKLACLLLLAALASVALGCGGNGCGKSCGCNQYCGGGFPFPYYGGYPAYGINYGAPYGYGVPYGGYYGGGLVPNWYSGGHGYCGGYGGCGGCGGCGGYGSCHGGCSCGCGSGCLSKCCC